jgi:DNA-binding MarR family transcriptional regulator
MADEKKPDEFEQLDLFGGEDAHARRGDPDTSHQAAARVDTTKGELKVLRVLGRLSQGGTSQEVADALGVPRDNISARFAPLERKMLIVRTPERRARRIVWKTTDRGKGFLYGMTAPRDPMTPKQASARAMR